VYRYLQSDRSTYRYFKPIPTKSSAITLSAAFEPNAFSCGTTSSINTLVTQLSNGGGSTHDSTLIPSISFAFLGISALLVEVSAAQ
jgi:hypothetical protein